MRRAYDLCEAALADDDKAYVALAESPLPEPVIHEQDDNPEWWQLYEVEIWNHKTVRSWFKPLRNPSDPAKAFENTARHLYALAGLTENEIAAVLLAHQGESFRRIARRLGISLASTQERIKRGEARLAALQEL